jgi:hypothetical protein
MCSVVCVACRSSSAMHSFFVCGLFFSTLVASEVRDRALGVGGALCFIRVGVSVLMKTFFGFFHRRRRLSLMFSLLDVCFTSLVLG